MRTPMGRQDDPVVPHRIERNTAHGEVGGGDQEVEVAGVNPQRRTDASASGRTKAAMTEMRRVSTDVPPACSYIAGAKQ